MASITLINPPSPFLLEQAMMPPLGILYVSSALKQKGVKVNFVDFAANPTAQIPIDDCYGITATTPQYPDAKKILDQIYMGEVAIGGPHATLCSEQCLNDGFDAAIIGEGEKAIFRFLDGAFGTIHEPFEKDLDNLPFPDRSLVKDYRYYIDGRAATTMKTARGCYYRKCAFCCQNWPNIRYRSAANVVEELRQISQQNYEGVMIYDDEFFTKYSRDFQIAWTIKTYGMVWRCFSRADLINEKVCQVGEKTDLKEMLIGIESGSRPILKNIRKGVTVEQNIRAIQTLWNHGIRVKAAMIIMLPGESPATLKETWHFCEEVESCVSDWDFTMCTPYPGSDIYENKQKYDFFFAEDASFSAYKGAGSNAWKPPMVWTTNLSFEQGIAARDKFEQRFKYKRDVKLD
jgi:radical SAM superfamily enzyme YgiQ (UPF0313 family)